MASNGFRPYPSCGEIWQKPAFWCCGTTLQSNSRPCAVQGGRHADLGEPRQERTRWVGVKASLDGDQLPFWRCPGRLHLLLLGRGWTPGLGASANGNPPRAPGRRTSLPRADGPPMGRTAGPGRRPVKRAISIRTGQKAEGARRCSEPQGHARHRSASDVGGVGDGTTATADNVKRATSPRAARPPTCPASSSEVTAVRPGAFY
ncbi:hypothetical protein VTN02DRAFT_1377 [Thermoascus thermophilus]